MVGGILIAHQQTYLDALGDRGYVLTAVFFVFKYQWKYGLIRNKSSQEIMAGDLESYCAGENKFTGRS